jgi:hypothetical protein
MLLPSPVAVPLSPEARAALAAGSVWHYTRVEHLDGILQEGVPQGNYCNALVQLRPPTGWQFDFWKFLRDAAVWDPDFGSRGEWGRYLYFFLGEPSAARRAMNVQDAPVSIEIRGADLLAAAGDRLLFRGLDRVVVLRGDYRGPARVEPLPIRI